jgi:hypothetical protein
MIPQLDRMCVVLGINTGALLLSVSLAFVNIHETRESKRIDAPSETLLKRQEDRLHNLEEWRRAVEIRMGKPHLPVSPAGATHDE